MANEKKERLYKQNRRKRRARKRVLLSIEAVCIVLLACILVFVFASDHEKTKQAEKEYAKKQEAKTAEELAVDDADGDSLEKTEKNGQAGDEQKDQVKEPEASGGDEALEESGENETAESESDTLGDGDGIVHMAFAGDICFHDAYSNMGTYVQRGSNIEKCISADLLEEMRGADIFMVNNEFPYSNRGTPVENKTYAFRSKPENVSILHDMGVDVVSLANNHAYDHGEEALLDTFDVLKGANMPYVGAGHNLDEASAPYIFSQEGIKIAILSATQIERTDNPDTRGATEKTPGTFRCWGKKFDDLLAAVEKTKAQADLVVVYIHWGTENTDVLDWAQRDQAKALAQAGVDLIVGDHPHCLQEIGQIGGVPVIYSLGNFWFNSKTVDTGLLKVDVSKSGIEKIQFLPAIQANCTTNMVSGAEKDRILNYMRSISTTVSIDGDGVVQY